MSSLSTKSGFEGLSPNVTKRRAERTAYAKTKPATVKPKTEIPNFGKESSARRTRVESDARRRTFTVDLKTLLPRLARESEQEVKNRSLAVLVYSQRRGGVDAYVQTVRKATPNELVLLERQGVQGTFIKDLSKSLDIASTRLYSILGVPKATLEKKAAAGELVTGRGGQSAIGMIKLLGIAQDLVDNSTASGAVGFDAAKWLGKWIETPQPALDGRKPADYIDTPTGVSIVARVLGSIQSGAYQ